MEIKIVDAKKENPPQILWTHLTGNLGSELDEQSKYLFNTLLEFLPSYTFRKLYQFMKDYMENK